MYRNLFDGSMATATEAATPEVPYGVIVGEYALPIGVAVLLEVKGNTCVPVVPRATAIIGYVEPLGEIAIPPVATAPLASALFVCTERLLSSVPEVVIG